MAKKYLSGLGKHLIRGLKAPKIKMTKSTFDIKKAMKIPKIKL